MLTAAAPPGWVRFVLPEGALLPTQCPSCLEPGVRPREVPSFGKRAGTAPFEAHYCEACAAHLDEAVTRKLGIGVAACLLGVLGASAAVLYLGTRALAAQLLLSVLAGAFIPVSASASGRTPDSTGSIGWLGGAHYVCAHPAYARLVSALPETTWGAPPRRFGWLVWPPLLAVVWCSTIQLLGRAELRVIEAEQDLTLLVDHAVMGRVPASLDETPETGRRIALLAGRRHLALVERSGAIRSEAWVTVLPGHTYLFGSAPADRCFFWERRGYGREAPPDDQPRRERLAGAGPLWDLQETVDFWFVPLPSPGLRWTSGGRLTALRLLPCRAASGGRH